MVRRLNDGNSERWPLVSAREGQQTAPLSDAVLHFVNTAIATGMDDGHFGMLAKALEELGPAGLLQRLTVPTPRPVSLAQPFRLRDKIDARLVMTDVRAQNWPDVVNVFCDALAVTSALVPNHETGSPPSPAPMEHEVFSAALISELADHFRKGGESFGWFLGTGVGVPHAFVAGLRVPRVAVVRLLRGLTGLQTPDDVPVRLLFFLLEPLDNVESHLLLLARIAHICGTVGNLGLLLAASGQESLLDCITALDYDIRNG